MNLKSKLKIKKVDQSKVKNFCFLIIFTFCFFTFSFELAAYAQKKAGAEEHLTKGEAVMLLSATDFMKQKISELLSWTVGYDISKVNRVKLTPTINYIKTVPRKVPPDGRTILEIAASVDDPGGLNNISGVRADLSSIGRLPNTMLVDNGLYGDRQSADGIFTLQTNVAPMTSAGRKDIPVAVANKKGWLALAKTTLEIKKNPVIVEILISPDRVLADGRTLATITVRVDNPGRNEDSQVTADLGAFNLSEQAALTAVGDVWQLSFTPPADLPAGNYSIPIQVTNLAGGRTSGTTALMVDK